jgi:hypothetical protein
VNHELSPLLSRTASYHYRDPTITTSYYALETPRSSPLSHELRNLEEKKNQTSISRSRVSSLSRKTNASTSHDAEEEKRFWYRRREEMQNAMYKARLRTMQDFCTLFR